MTEHYTKEEAVELARECGFTDDEIYPKYTQALINAAVSRKLAEKELEVARLREALTWYANQNHIETLHGRESQPSSRDDLMARGFSHVVDGWTDVFVEQGTRAEEALSTPSSTKHLDEYVAGKVKELEKDALSDKADLVSKAMEKAWQLGQTYWQQADSESWSENKKSGATYAKFQTLVDETRAAIERSE